MFVEHLPYKAHSAVNICVHQFVLESRNIACALRQSSRCWKRWNLILCNRQDRRGLTDGQPHHACTAFVKIHARNDAIVCVPIETCYSFSLPIDETDTKTYRRFENHSSSGPGLENASRFAAIHHDENSRGMCTTTTYICLSHVSECVREGLLTAECFRRESESKPNGADRQPPS